MPSKRLTHVHEVVITDTTRKYKNVENLLHRHILQKEFNFLAFWLCNNLQVFIGGAFYPLQSSN